MLCWGPLVPAREPVGHAQATQMAVCSCPHMSTGFDCQACVKQPLDVCPVPGPCGSEAPRTEQLPEHVPVLRRWAAGQGSLPAGLLSSILKPTSTEVGLSGQWPWGGMGTHKQPRGPPPPPPTDCRT